MTVKNTLFFALLMTLLSACGDTEQQQTTSQDSSQSLHKTGLSVDYWAEQAIQLCAATHRKHDLLSTEQYETFFSTNNLIRINLIPRLTYFDISIYPSNTIQSEFVGCRVLHEDGSIAGIIANTENQEPPKKELALKAYDAMGGLDKIGYNAQLKKAIEIDLYLNEDQLSGR